MDSIDLKLPDLYINRELSQLEFNRRVLEQAKDDRTPLLEQLRAIPPAADEAERERRVVELWNPDLLDYCQEAAPWRELYLRTSGRREILKRDRPGDRSRQPGRSGTCWASEFRILNSLKSIR